MWNPNIYKENECKPSTKHAKENVQIVENTEIGNQKKKKWKGATTTTKIQIPLFAKGDLLQDRKTYGVT